MLGQAQLSLRDVTDFTKKGVYQSSFMEKIKVRQLSEPALLLLSSLVVVIQAIICIMYVVVVSECS